METVAGSADLATATVAAMRGDHDQVAPLLARVLAAVDTSEYRGFAARTRHAAGLDALARGHYVTAYAQLSRLFAADGTPLHHHFSYLGIADLAAAAARADRRLEARTLLERALARVDPAPGSRLEQLAARARGLLAEPADAAAYFAAPLADSAGTTWPFERAQLQLDYGEWLRRRRRINDAKPLLGEALETFRRLDAAPWTRRTEAELRACGVTAQDPRAPGALAGLTAQQREIVILAGHGLTNSEIADRLFVSPAPSPRTCTAPTPSSASPAVTSSATSSTTRARRVSSSRRIPRRSGGQPPGRGRNRVSLACLPSGCGRSLGDEGGYRCGLGYVDRVAGGDFGDGGPGALGHRTLRGRRDHPVLRGDQVPAWLDPPGGFADRSAERVHAPGDLGVGHERGLSGGQVAGEGGGELVAVEEEEAVLGRQDRRLRPVSRETGDERVDRLALVWRECADVRQGSYLIVQARLGDHGPAVGMADQDRPGRPACRGPAA